MNDLPDRDNDGIPDVIEDSLEEARSIKRLFGTKGLIIILFIAIIFAAFGTQTWLYFKMKDNYVALQQQYDWQQTENEIEINAALIAERKEILEGLQKKAEVLEKDIAIKKTARKNAEHEIVAKPYARRNEHEASKLNTTEIMRAFNDLGFPTKSSSK